MRNIVGDAAALVILVRSRFSSNAVILRVMSHLWTLIFS